MRSGAAPQRALEDYRGGVGDDVQASRAFASPHYQNARGTEA
jgi:hypothetical protein